MWMARMLKRENNEYFLCCELYIMNPSYWNEQNMSRATYQQQVSALEYKPER